MGIAVAAIEQDWLAIGARRRRHFEPDLADAAAHLVDVVMGGLAQRLQRPAEVNDVAIAVLPIVEDGEIAANVFDTGQWSLFRVRQNGAPRDAKPKRLRQR